GERAGPTIITASVGTLTRTALVHADPGPPEVLVVARGDAPVAGSLTLRSRDTVVLRVVARDRYGNRTTVDAFAATSTGRAIAVRSPGGAAADSAAVVVLEPRRYGAGRSRLAASSLWERLALYVLL